MVSPIVISCHAYQNKLKVVSKVCLESLLKPEIHSMN